VKDQTSVVLDRKVVNIDTPIRTTGAHQVSVALFDGITGVVNLSVVAQ
jgi:ribosomal protein L9